MRSKDVVAPLYVSRRVLNSEDIIKWARSQGLSSMLEPDDLHVTICYSKEAMKWSAVPDGDETIRVPALDEFETDDAPVRQMEMFGKENNVLVIQLESDDLHARWQEFCDNGASYDFPEYKPHITITYKGGSLGEASGKIEPYRGEIVLGPERFKKIDKAWAGDAKEIDLTEEPLPFELNEGVEYSDGNFVILRDPSSSQLSTLLSRSKSEDGLRAILIDNTLYVWDAYYLVHAAAMRMLGLTRGCCMHVKRDEVEIEVSDIGFVPHDLDDNGWSDDDLRWFAKAYAEVRQAEAVLSDMAVLRRLYGEDVPITYDDTTQWEELRHFMATQPALVEDANGGDLEDDIDENLLEARSELVGNIRVIINPNAGELADMCSRYDLRGVGDGKSVYVWPAQAATHMDVMHELGIDMRFYRSRFYAFMPDFGETPKRAASRMEGNAADLSIHEIPRVGVYLAATPGSVSMLEQTSTGARWFRPRTEVTEGVEEGSNGLRYFRNPSRSQFRALLARYDLRGLIDTDSGDVFVWDAGAQIHFSASRDIGIDWLTHNLILFYAHSSDSEGDWEWKDGEHGMGIHKKVDLGRQEHVIVDSSEADQALQSRNMQSMLGVRERKREPEPETELVEATSDPLPKKFWLVFDVPTSKNLGDDGSKMDGRLAEIGSGELTGIRGISDTRQIMTGWFLMCRNAVAVMDPAAVAAVNDVEKIRYDDAEYLTRDNFAALYRVWDKEGKNGARNHYGMFQNVMQYVIAYLKKVDEYLASQMSNSGLEWRAAKLWEADPTGVNTPEEAGRKVYELVLKVCEEEKSYYGFGNIKETMTVEKIVSAVQGALLYVGSIYSDEGEWIVTGDTFVIPRNTILMLGINPDIAARYPEWLEKKDTDFTFQMNSYAYEAHHNLMTAIEKYNLRERYVLRLVDAKKFEALRGDVMSKRRKAG